MTRALHLRRRTLDQASPAEDDDEAQEDIASRKYKACRRCRRLKMKCEYSGGPTCNRCRQAKAECLFDAMEKKRGSTELEKEYMHTTKRLKSLEAQVNQFEGTMKDLVNSRKEHGVSKVVHHRYSVQENDLSELHKSPPTRDNCNSSRIIENISQAPDTIDDSMSQGSQSSSGLSVSQNKELETITSTDLHAPLQSINEMVAIDENVRNDKTVHKNTDATGTNLAEKSEGQPRNRLRQSESASLAQSPGISRLARVLATQKESIVIEDPITGHSLSEYKARTLFNFFFTNCVHISPMFDQIYDTFDSLRTRSKFCLYAILAVADQIESGGAMGLGKSDRLCQKAARELAGKTLFEDTIRLEDIQGMLLMAAYSEKCWYLIGHAVRMAKALHLDKALSQLIENMEEKTSHLKKDVQNATYENVLIRKARTWLVLAHVEREIASGTARQSHVTPDKQRLVEELLKHPLSTASDIQIAANIQLVSLRDKFQNKIIFSELNADQAGSDISEVGNEFDRWLEFWDTIYIQKGYHATSFHRCNLKMQRNYAEIIICCTMLGKFESYSGVLDLKQAHSEQWNEIIRQTYSCAEEQVSFFLDSDTYKWHVKFCPTYAAMTVAFATVLALKISRYQLQTTDTQVLRLCARHVANVLQDYTFANYARVIKLMLKLLQSSKDNSAIEKDSSQTREPNTPLQPSIDSLQTTWGAHPSTRWPQGEEGPSLSHGIAGSDDFDPELIGFDNWQNESIEQLLVQSRQDSVTQDAPSVLLAPGWIFEQAGVDSLGLPKEGSNSIFAFDVPVAPRALEDEATDYQI